MPLLGHPRGRSNVRLPRVTLLSACGLLVMLIGTTVVRAALVAFPGTWEVVQVGVDSKDQPHWRYEANDPRLLGRQLVLGNDDRIRFDFGRDTCAQVNWSSEPRTTLGALVGRTFPRPTQTNIARNPTPKDFGLDVPDHAVAPAVASCTGSRAANGAPLRWGQAWFVLLTPDKMLVAYDSDTLLVFARVAPNTPAKPSFPCSGALAPAESTICASADLAGYDRSVAAAFRRTVKRNPTDAQALKNAQHQWLEQRDQCKADVTCLVDKMRDRIDALMQD